jgi:Fe-Mn family superoxide dismutase
MFTLPELPYAYDALEPHIDEATMHIHHDKHHKAYMDKFNTALEKYPDFYKKTVEEILSDLNSVPEDVRTAVKNNGGGYYHHSIFWQMMSPNKSAPKGKINEAIDKAFGSFDKFKEKFATEASTHFASGWTWLVKDKKNNLSIISTPNQDSPISQGLTPFLGIDTWEHAYYLKYQNRRPEYIEAWWNVANWDYAEKIFKS